MSEIRVDLFSVLAFLSVLTFGVYLQVGLVSFGVNLGELGFTLVLCDRVFLSAALV